jgi:carbon storage regulator
MLVLSRQKNEAIMIGDEIEIVVVDIRGDRVRLGISAPGRIPVHRKEIYEAIKRENIEASRTQLTDLSSLGKLFGKSPAQAAPDGKKDDSSKDKKGL